MNNHLYDTFKLYCQEKADVNIEVEKVFSFALSSLLFAFFSFWRFIV